LIIMEGDARQLFFLKSILNSLWIHWFKS
jgi:hypothetical protein